MAEKEKKLYLLDAMALIYRAHFALIRSPRFTSDNRCTSAVFGVTNTVFDIINKQNPTHIAVAFDTREPTFRHEKFPEYKAQRDALPEDIAEQFPLIDQLFDAMNITMIRQPGFEADDIVGTIAFEAEQQGFHTFMVTPDKDYTQLVSEKTTMYKPGRQGSGYELLGVPEVLEKWQVERVDQVVDILGLMGDASDNIPGVPGIGPKTAQKLIAQFGTVEELLKNTDKLKGKQKERVEENKEQALLSKDLVTIRRDVPHDVNLDDLVWNGFDEEKLKKLFAEVEFDSLGKRLFGKKFTTAPTRQKKIREKREKEIQATLFDEPVKQTTIKTRNHNYVTVKTKSGRADLIKNLLAQPRICFDTETTGLNPREAFPLGIAFSYEAGKAFYAVIPEDPAQAQMILDEFRPVFENDAIEKVGHNLKYDVTLLKWHGVEVRGKLFDTMLAHSMKEPEMQHGLDYLSKLYLGYEPIPTTDLLGPKGDQQRNMRDVPVEIVSEYACEDADVTLQVAGKIVPDIEARGVAEVCYDVECPLIPVLVDMEHEGIRLDVKALADFSKVLEDDIEGLEEKIYIAAGREFNIGSPKQLGIVLFEDLQLVEKPKKTSTGQYSTREAELLRLAPKHQIVTDVLDFRNAMKLKSVYVDQLPGSVNPKTGKLHTHYSQTWTATGRMQSINPNLQTIPVRKERGREIRAAFVPRDEDFLIMSADYSQVELRIMAALSGDKGMLEAFESGTDIHTVTAAKVYKVPFEDVDREMRSKAKMVNFGILYGISVFGLQQRLNIPRKEASQLIDGYFENHPAVQTYIDKTIAFAEEHGYVKTQTGRRRELRDINSRSRTIKNQAERLAMNSPIQGTAADMLKLAMIKVHHALRDGGFQTKMLLTVHDELVFDMHKSEKESVMPVIEQAMKTALPLECPIEVEMGYGKNWLEAH
jgi:DNA polymerase-1